MEWILVLIVIFAISVYIGFRTRRIKFDGTIVVKENEEGKKLFSLEVDIDLDEIEKMDIVIFKVVKEKSTN